METANCHICGSHVSTHDDAGQLSLAYCGDCGKPTCADHRDESSATRCTDCASVPRTVGQRVEKIQRIYQHASIQNKNTFQANPYGTMVKRYGGNLRTYIKVKNAISETFDKITTGIYEGKKASDPL